MVSGNQLVGGLVGGALFLAFVLVMIRIWKERIATRRRECEEARRKLVGPRYERNDFGSKQEYDGYLRDWRERGP